MCLKGSGSMHTVNTYPLADIQGRAAYNWVDISLVVCLAEGCHMVGGLLVTH